MELSIQRMGRDSSFELFRIVLMLLIIAHHYVVNSELPMIIKSAPVTLNGVLALCLGAWGKIGINCYVLITGYFMCQRNISLNKFFRLYFEVVFYGIICNIFFLLTGHVKLDIWLFVDIFFPFRWLSFHFVHAFLIFFLAIPFLNILVNGMTKREHQLLMVFTLGVFSVLPTIPFLTFNVNYVVWFCVVYFVGSYLRKYSSEWMRNQRLIGFLSLISCVAAIASVLLMAYVVPRYVHTDFGIYYWVSDCNKIMAFFISVCFFIFFRNLNLGCVKFVNQLASTCFGVLLLHANSDVMRHWLWTDVCCNKDWFYTPYFILHAVVSILLVYCACSALDFVRQLIVEKMLPSKS